MMQNLLPFDGEAYYYENLFNDSEKTVMFDALLSTIAWKNDETIIYGKHIITRRKMAWYGSKPYAYKYSGIVRQALPWTDELSHIKSRVENKSSDTYNACLLNLYHSGEEGMGWHADNETSLQRQASIASVSFGAARKFSFKHRGNGESVSLVLQPGSLLLMKGDTQANWVHSLPKSTKIKEARINLTFRSMVE